MTTTDRFDPWEHLCRCGHNEAAHRWAGDLGHCNTTPCPCLVYQIVPLNQSEALDMAAQDEVRHRRSLI